MTLTQELLQELKELRSAAIMFRDAAYRAAPTLRVSNEAVNMLSARLLTTEKTIAKAEADNGQTS